MAFQFPASPSIGQTITNTDSKIVYTWNGTVWTYSQPTTASTATYANVATGFPVFSNGQNQFNWIGAAYGNPTSSGATLAGNATWNTSNNYDGVILTPAANAQNGSCYWSGSSVVAPTQDKPIWVTFWAKAVGSADGIQFILNSNNPITGSPSTAVDRGVVVFLDEFNGGGSNPDIIKIYNSGSLRSTVAPLNNNLSGDFFNRWDILLYKSGSNHFMNIWQGQAQETGAPDKMNPPVLLALSTTSDNTNQTVVNLGPTWPTGGFFGFQGFTGGLNAIHFVQNLQIRSGVLLPANYFGGYYSNGFS